MIQGRYPNLRQLLRIMSTAMDTCVKNITEIVQRLTGAQFYKDVFFTVSHIFECFATSNTY